MLRLSVDAKATVLLAKLSRGGYSQVEVKALNHDYLLDTLQTVFQFAQNMTYNGLHPVVEMVEKTYHTGVKLTQKAIAELENRFDRLPGLEKYFVTISPLPNSILG